MIDVLSMQAGLPIRDWRFKQVALGIHQADGTTTWRSGYIQTIQQMDADGGLVRYRLTLAPGIWLATQARRNRVFQNKPILQVIEDVLAPYAPYVRFACDAGRAQGDMKHIATVGPDGVAQHARIISPKIAVTAPLRRYEGSSAPTMPPKARPLGHERSTRSAAGNPIHEVVMECPNPQTGSSMR